MNGCKKQVIKFFWLATLITGVIGLTSCSSEPAPIVDGWQQSAGKRSHYTVQKGDTLYSVAWAFDLDYRDLAQINHLTPPYALQKGQILYMSSPSQHVASSAKLFAYPETPAISATNLSVLPLPEKSVATAKHNTIHTALPAKISLPISQRPLVTTENNKFTNQWQWPVKGKIIKRFAPSVGGNKGIEIGGYVGEPIVAVAPGKVVYSGSGIRGYGKLLIIKHNDNFLSAYAYNKTLLVKEGMMVAAGQKIALMGNNSAGQISLHFEIRRNGKPINPVELLR